MKRLEAQLHAVLVLKERTRADTSGVQAPLDLGKDEKPPKFAESVRQAIATFTNEEFLVVNVEKVLIARNVKMPAKNARARIAMVLQDLVKRGVVMVAHKGQGNSPYRYRLLEQTEAESEKGGGMAFQRHSPPRRLINVHGRTPRLAA
jgi:hypothetical protein